MGVVANSYAGKHFTMYQINTSYTSHLHDVTMLRANYISVTGGGGISRWQDQVQGPLDGRALSRTQITHAKSVLVQHFIETGHNLLEHPAGTAEPPTPLSSVHNWAASEKLERGHAVPSAHPVSAGNLYTNSLFSLRGLCFCKFELTV